MADVFTPKKRSEVMSQITSKDTSPELAVRKALYSMGVRYRLHVKDLPGTPDIANKSKKFAIFVNGCFWHQHSNCKRSNLPKSNKEYWHPKLEKNVQRQKRNIDSLKKQGYKVVVVWECEAKDDTKLKEKLSKFYE